MEVIPFDLWVGEVKAQFR